LIKKKLRIGIIGAGSIGSLFGGYIAGIKSDKYSIEVIFFCKKTHAEAINQNGLKIYKNQKVKEIKSIRAYIDEKHYERKIRKNSSFGFNFLFLTTKAYDIETAMLQYKKLIEESRWLIILQNGIGNEDTAIKYCSKSDLIRAVTTNGALLNGPGDLIHTGEGITKIGFPFLEESDKKARVSDLEFLRDLLNLAGLETIIVDDIVKECWEKIFINVGINAIGALTRLSNGKLLEFDDIKYLMGESIREALKVAKMKNVKLPKKNYISITYKVAMKTAENKNSMLQDILNGKMTEIDFINGRILKYARELGIEVPLNKFLTYLIKGIERSSI